MNRKSFLKQLGFLTAGTVITPGLLNLSRYNGPFYTIRNKIGYFSGRGGTIGWYISNRSIVVIDSQFQNSAQDFLKGIFDYGQGGSDRYLFNTHHHGDHVSGNGIFQSDDFQIIAHKNVPELQKAGADPANFQSLATADTTFDGEYSIRADDESVTAKYYGRGHTGGDSVIWLENGNVAHMGDLVFNRWYPFIDREGGASIENWINILESTANEADRNTVFIFGHGSSEYGVTGNSDDLLYMRDYLSKLLEYTSEGIQSGLSLDELSSIKRFEEFPNHQSAGSRLSLQANIQAAYEELTENN